MSCKAGLLSAVLCLLAPMLANGAEYSYSTSESTTTDTTTSKKRDHTTLVYPIRSRFMTPGRFESYPVQMRRPLPRPLCFIGTDRYSLVWLRENAGILRDSGTVCMVVSAEHPRDLERIARMETGVPMIPAPADDAARMFGVRHYPALISNGMVEQ